jgi:hypothetical protein
MSTGLPGALQWNDRFGREAALSSRRLDTPSRDRAPAADRVDADEYPDHGRDPLITFGIVLVILALIFNSAILWIIGGILIVLGVIFWILGALGRAVGGRRHYY